MPASAYKLIIHIVFGNVLLAMTLPIAVYLLRIRNRRLDDVLAYFNEEAVDCYYKQFQRSRPKTVATKSASDSEMDKQSATPESQSSGSKETLRRDLKESFDQEMRKRFSSLYFIPPILLQVLTALCLLLGADNTLCAWLGLNSASNFVFTPLGMSALAGAGTWTIWDELVRLRKGDFTTTDVYNYSLRLLTAVPFAWVLAHLLVDTARIPIAFFLGAFPTAALFQIARRLAAKQLNLADDPVTGTLELEKLECINKTNAERFQDEGIHTISQLAYCDPIDLTFRTNFCFNYVVECVGQALLGMYLPNRGDSLLPYSLRDARNASFLVAALNGKRSSNEGKEALVTLRALAVLIKVPEETLKLTLERVEQDPYTIFLRHVWH